jgi:hypothetical protein
LISAFSFPLLLPFTRRLHAEAELEGVKIFMTNGVYRIKQCGTPALTKNSLLFAFRQTANQSTIVFLQIAFSSAVVGDVQWASSPGLYRLASFIMCICPVRSPHTFDQMSV